MRSPDISSRAESASSVSSIWGLQLRQEQLRFAVLVQHFVSQDTMDFRRPPEKRMHDDVFEGSTRARRMQDVITKLYKAGLLGLVYRERNRLL